MASAETLLRVLCLLATLMGDQKLTEPYCASVSSSSTLPSSSSSSSSSSGPGYGGVVASNNVPLSLGSTVWNVNKVGAFSVGDVVTIAWADNTADSFTGTVTAVDPIGLTITVYATSLSGSTGINWTPWQFTLVSLPASSSPVSSSISSSRSSSVSSSAFSSSVSSSLVSSSAVSSSISSSRSSSVSSSAFSSSVSSSLISSSISSSSSSSSPPIIPSLVFIAAGQSNMVGYSVDGVPLGASTPYASPYVTQLGRYNGNNFLVIPAVDPMDYPSQTSGHSQAIPFGYTVNQHTGRNVTLIPCAWGGTGFTGTVNWTPVNMSDPASATNPSFLYYDCTNRTNFLLAQTSLYILGGILWDQGEAEAENGVSGSQWLADVDNLVASWRHDLIGGTNASFVSVQILPSYVVSTGPTSLSVQNAIDSVPFNITYSATVYGQDASGNSFLSGDGGAVHYSAVSQQLLGILDYGAWVAAQSNRSTPGPILQTFATLASGTVMNFTWTPDPASTYYLVWVNQTTSYNTTSPFLVLSSLTPCTEYSINVTGVGASGFTGVPSTPNVFRMPCFDAQYFFPLQQNYSDVLNPYVSGYLATITTECPATFTAGTLPSGAAGAYWWQTCGDGNVEGVGTNVYLPPSFTLSAWFLPPTGTLGTYLFLFGAWPVTGPGAYSFWCYLDNSAAPATHMTLQLNGQQIASGVVVSSQQLTNWTMFTLTHNSATQQAYIYANQAAIAGPISTSGTGFSSLPLGSGWPIAIGGFPNSNALPWQGGITLFRVFNSSLSAATIASQFYNDSNATSIVVHSSSSSSSTGPSSSSSTFSSSSSSSSSSVVSPYAWQLLLTSNYADSVNASLIATLSDSGAATNCTPSFASVINTDSAAGTAFLNPCNTSNLNVGLPYTTYPANYTVEVWLDMLPTAYYAQYALISYVGGVGVSFTLYITNSATNSPFLYVVTGPNNFGGFTSILPSGTPVGWHHYASTYNSVSGAQALYVDGQLAFSNAGTPSSTWLSSPRPYPILASDNSGPSLPGYYYNFLCWPSVLNATQVQQEYWTESNSSCLSTTLVGTGCVGCTTVNSTAWACSSCVDDNYYLDSSHHCQPSNQLMIPGNLISFELPSITGGYVYNPSTFLYTWTTSQGGVAATGSPFDPPAPATPPDGVQYAFLQQQFTNLTIPVSQLNVSLVYNLSYYWGTRNGGVGPSTTLRLTIYLGGVQIYQSPQNLSDTGGWAHVVVSSIQPTSTTSSLIFSSAGLVPGDQTLLLDAMLILPLGS